MNRFYRPSAPRYTSQFVEDQYPVDLMLQAGAMKYQQKQKTASDIAAFQALNDTLQPGYRTVRMAPETINKWHTRINDTVTKFATNYDSPQAMMEFMKLKNEWIRDPDVQLIKYDRELGNKEWDEIRKSPTLQLDINPNADPQTGMLKQFNLGDSYTQYSPLIKYADIAERAMKEYNSIEAQTKYAEKEVPYIDAFGRQGMKRLQGEYTYRDPKMLAEKTQNLIQRTMQGKEPWAAYLLATAQRNLGRNPTEEELAAYFNPYERGAAQYKENFNTSWDKVTKQDMEGIRSMNNATGTTVQTEHLQRPDVWSKINKSYYTNRGIKRLFGKGTTTVNSDDIALDKIISLRDPAYNSLSPAQKDKMKKEYLRTQGDKFDLQINYLGSEAEQELNAVVAGKSNDKGIITEDVSSAIIRGSSLFDLQKGEFVQDMGDKDALTKKGNTFRVYGRIQPDSFGMQPMPGSVFIEAGDPDDPKQYVMVSPDAYKEERPQWNFYGYQRSSTGVGDVFALDFVHKNAPPIITDVTEPGNNMDDKNIQARTKNGVYIVPVNEGLEYGNVKVKVYSKNPSDINVFDNNNSALIKEYNLADYYDNEAGMNPMEALRMQLYTDMTKRISGK